MSGNMRLGLRGLSGLLIISSLVVPRVSAPDNGVWALVALMIGIALTAGLQYRQVEDV